jgi:hypothetical protein
MRVLCLTFLLCLCVDYAGQDVERLTELRKKLGEDGRDNLTISLQSENQERLKTATEMHAQLKSIQAKDEKKKKKSEKDVADRREMVELLGCDILGQSSSESIITAWCSSLGCR